MKTVIETLSLLKRHWEIETAMRQPDGIRITEEMELQRLRERFRQYPKDTFR